MILFSIFFGALKFLPIYLFINLYYKRIQTAIIDGNLDNSSNTCGRYGDTPSYSFNQFFILIFIQTLFNYNSSDINLYIYV